MRSRLYTTARKAAEASLELVKMLELEDISSQLDREQLSELHLRSRAAVLAPLSVLAALQGHPDPIKEKTDE